MKLFFAILFVASTASAAVIYQSGFESPGYTPGVLAGQDGWLNITAPSGNIVVQSGISRSGTQAVDFSASGAQAFTRDSRLTGYDTSVPGNDNNVSTSTDFMLGTTGTPSAWRLTGYYSSNNFIGYLGVTASGAVTLGNMVLGTTLTRGVWYNLQVDYNFTTLQYTGYLNGVSVGSRAFSSAGATAQFGSVYFENAAPGTDHAYFDNVSVSSFSSTPVVPLVYGQTYYLQNGYNNYAGGFLDTDDIGCQGDLLCVSTASTPIRDSGSGTWMILPVTPGRALGDKVQSGDAVQLANVYGYTTVGAENAGGLVNFGGFLDTSGQGCQDNLLCVATSSSSNRDSGSGTWRIELTAAAASVGSTVNSGDGFTLKNGSANFNGGYLDTRGIGCQNNLLCVSTASVINRDNGSGTWKASVPPPPAALVYGQTYYLQNGYQDFRRGGYLDTNGIGCQDDLLCVSTASTPIRNSGSGTWMILPATPGRALGDKVQSGDSVHLANLYGYAPVGTESAGGLINFGGFLDTAGQGCQGNLLCVATSSSRNRDSGSGTWKIELIDPFTNPTVITGLACTLSNGYGNFSGGYLDTDDLGCNGNFLCVSTSSVRNRDSGSGSWRAVTPIPLSTATPASKKGGPQ